jgi:NAD(P)H-dependent flavin oxidoreductase YrpB (nitropropane dioxygenase family)
MFGIKYPIVLAGMGYVSGPLLTAAVSNAGGLGVLGAASYTVEQLPEMIARTRALTDKPFGVDLPMPPQLDDIPVDATEETLKSLFPKEAVAYVERFGREQGIPKAVGIAGLQVFSIAYTREIFKICIKEKIPLFVSAVGDPSWCVAEAHDHGMKVMSVCGLVRQGRRLTGNGVDLIVAQGTEAGGHTGRIGTMPLVPQMVDAIKPKPVLAAGGIADGRGVAAALALGAIGVWLGTRFVATEEANIESIEMGYNNKWEVDTIKKKILAATEDDTTITRTLTGKTLRTIKNKFQVTWEGQQGPILKTPLQNVLVADLQEGVREAGKEEYVYAVAGQISGMIKDIKPAAQVVEEIVEETIHVLEKMRSIKI